MTIDPNLWASLARQYTGGINAPAPGQAGYVARVDAAGTNIEYVPWIDALTTDLVEPGGAIVGGIARQIGTVSTTATTTVPIGAALTLVPGALHHVRILISAYSPTAGAWMWLADKLYLCNNDPTAMLLATHSAAAYDALTGTATVEIVGGTLVPTAAANVADGATQWRSLLVDVYHSYDGIG